MSSVKLLFLAAVVSAFASVRAAETPPPLTTDPGEASPAVLKALNCGEVSVAMDVRFGDAPSAGSPTALFPLALTADGRVLLTAKAAPVALEGDFSLVGRRPVEPGAWHHVAFVCSLIRQRTALYVDGSLVYENDNVYLPRLGLGGVPTVPFGGEVKDFKAWDVALESERIIPSSVPGKSLWDLRAERNAAALRARVDAELAANPKAVKTESLVAYVTDPMSQEMVLPDRMPDGADFSGSLDVVAAQDEFEAASLVVMARQPVGSFTVKMGALRCGDATLAAEDVDIRLVKRWYRTGGAWFSYFADFRQRVLTPHLLVYDDDLIRVDEIRTRNYYRLDYPEGTRYVDVSDPTRGRERWTRDIPFRDAKSLRPIRSLDAFGRNQQYWILFHVKKGQKPGVYRGALDLVVDGKTVAQMPVNVRVLDFALPARGASYDDLSRFYISHCNIQGSIIQGRTIGEMRASALAELKSIRNHNSLDTNSIHGDPKVAELSREAGFPEDEIWEELPVPAWQRLFKGKSGSELTAEDRALGMRFAERRVRARSEDLARRYPNARRWCLFYSESSGYRPLSVWQQDQAEIAHKLGWSVFAHGMSDRNFHSAAESQDMQIQSSFNRGVADQWHALKAPVATYAKPFAAPEAPAVHRRLLGFSRYKASRFDGNMQHGVMDRNPNQFAPDPGGDGEYRCQIMLYPQQAGIIETICWEGVREAFDDIRYATLLKRLAEPQLQASDPALRAEARRALAWLENQDGDTASLQTVRMGIADRILNLRALIGGGK